jgi:hypothetical protein
MLLAGSAGAPHEHRRFVDVTAEAPGYVIAAGRPVARCDMRQMLLEAGVGRGDQPARDRPVQNDDTTDVHDPDQQGRGQRDPGRVGELRRPRYPRPAADVHPATIR